MVAFLDEHCRHFIERSPFFFLASSSAGGSCDASPRGGPPGFVRILDERRLAIPDYTGNRRADSHRNILESPHVELLFLIPGLRETLRVAGRACLTRSPELLESLVTGGTRPPKLAVGVAVERCFLHCGKAFHRSSLWDSSTWPERSELPSPAAIFRDHLGDPEVTLPAVEERVRTGYAERLW